MRLKRIPEVGKIKSAVVFGVGLLCGLGGALTGIAPQAAYSPSLVWMLGYVPGRANGVGTRFALWTSLIAAFSVAFLTPRFHSSLILEAILLFVGSTLGVMLALPARSLTLQRGIRTLGKVAGIGLGLMTMILTLRHNGFSGDFGVAGNHWALLGGSALGAGILASLLGITPAIVLVPALFFLVGVSAPEAILLSLMTTVFACLLPLVRLRAEGMTEGRFSDSGLFGGALGAIVGGIILSRLMQTHFVGSLAFFAVTAMFLSSRELLLLQNASIEAAPPQN